MTDVVSRHSVISSLLRIYRAYIVIVTRLAYFELSTTKTTCERAKPSHEPPIETISAEVESMAIKTDHRLHSFRLTFRRNQDLHCGTIQMKAHCRLWASCFWCYMSVVDA